MIIEMARVRLMGPRGLLQPTLAAVQDLGLLHLASPREDARCHPLVRTAAQEAECARLQGLIGDLEAIARLLGPLAHRPRAGRGLPLASWPEHATALRAELEALEERRRGLEEERALLVKYQALWRGFEPLMEAAAGRSGVRIHHLMLRGADRSLIAELRSALVEVVGDGFELATQEVGKGEVAVALLVPTEAGERVERVLASAPLEAVPLPEGYADLDSLSSAVPRMRARLAAIPAEQQRLEAERGALAARHAWAARQGLAAAYERLAELDALAHAAETARAFVLEGWVPAEEVDRLGEHVAHAVGPEVAVERVGAEEWSGEDVPVVLRNPRLFRPFETLTRLMPLPRYGSLDPTPFVAVGFPMLFGIILGDLGYAAVLAVLSAVLRRRAQRGSVWRAVSAIGLTCAAFAALFGVLYGELFGDLGRRLLGLQALALHREEAIVPALIFALSLGLIHVLLGLVLGVATALRLGGQGRKALGRGAAALMLLLAVAALLTVVEVLPAAFFTPLIVTVVALFAVLIVAEGVLAPVKLISTFAHVLSYARVMAVGTASVMLAVVANRLAGAMGSVLVGALFALVFHVINFAIGVFSPTVHVLRLHFVEFMGTFYSPGGTAYRPLGRWRHHEQGLPP